jgi:hypothetical protein
MALADPLAPFPLVRSEQRIVLLAEQVSPGSPGLVVDASTS